MTLIAKRAGGSGMGARLTTENYLKVMTKSLSESGRERMSTGELSRLLGVTPGTATSMLKRLEAAGHVKRQSHRGCQLTEKGRAYGIRMLRRHRLVELFLVKSLELDWTEVHEEAENLEHAISDRLVDRIDSILGHPARDPHGDLIPAKSQSQLEASDRALASLAPGSGGRVSRVEGDARTLAYLKQVGLVPGAEVSLVRIRAEAGLIDVKIDGKPKRLAISALKGIFV